MELLAQNLILVECALATHMAACMHILTAVKTGNAAVGVQRAEGDGEAGAVAVLVVDLMNGGDYNNSISKTSNARRLDECRIKCRWHKGT